MNPLIEGALAALGAVVYGLGVWALMSVDSTGGDRLDLLPALYQGLRFFILDPYGMPSGDWSAGHLAFWSALFGAPALLAGKLIDLVRILSVQAGHSFWPNGWFSPAPIVVCGFGAHGRTIASVSMEAGYRVIVIDSVDVSDGTGFALVNNARARFVRGDFTTPGVLLRAEAQRAHQVWFCAGDPSVNLRAARAAAGLPAKPGRAPKLIPMVDSDWEVGAIRNWRDLYPQIQPFIQFQEAATALIDMWNAGNSRRIPDTNLHRVAIIGFGRLGRAVLDKIAEASPEAATMIEVSVVDPKAVGKVVSWRDRNPGTGIQVVSIGCVADEYAWPEASRPSVAFICTSEDHANLRMAHQLQLRSQVHGDALNHGLPNAGELLVLLRMHDSEMANIVTPEDSAQDDCHNVRALSLDQVIKDAARAVICYQGSTA